MNLSDGASRQRCSQLQSDEVEAAWFGKNQDHAGGQMGRAFRPVTNWIQARHRV